MNHKLATTSIVMFAAVLGLGVISPAMAASTIIPPSITGVVEPGAEIVKTLTVAPNTGTEPFTVTATNDCGVGSRGLQHRAGQICI